MGKKLSFEEVNKRLEDNNRPVRLIGPYTNAHTETLFSCLICDWKWEATTGSVLNHGTGCPYCAGQMGYTTEIFNEKLKRKGRFVKMISNYIGSKEESIFNCLVCDHIWKTVPNIVLFGNGCPCCAGQLDYTTESFNDKLEKQGRTVRLLGNYIRGDINALFGCLICNHNWNPKPKTVMNGSGCPKCSKYGFNYEKPAVLYYIEIDYNKNKYYKIGITNNKINKRFTKDELCNMNIIHKINYKLGIDAYNKEQDILKEFNEYRYNGEPILKSGGNTEIFTLDIRKVGFQC